jgi:hypothetical protein
MRPRDDPVRLILERRRHGQFLGALRRGHVQADPPEGEPSTDANMPKPPPFHGLRPAVRARVICAAATTINSTLGATIAAARAGLKAGLHINTSELR